MTEPFKPSPTDIQNLQTIRRAINRTTYRGGLGIKASGKMLGTMDRLLASFGLGPDDHGELEDGDPLKNVPVAYERLVPSLASSGQGDNCRCPAPITCSYCSRMYPCDCAGCPSKKEPECTCNPSEPPLHPEQHAGSCPRYEPHMGDEDGWG